MRDLGCRNLGDGQGGRNLGVVGGMRAVGRTLPGAGAKRILDDLVDRASAAAAFGAAAQAAIDLPCRARQAGRSAHRAADVVIAQHIAGTDDQGVFRCDAVSSIVKGQPQGKAKRLNFKIFQTVVVKRRAVWNQSKQPLRAVCWLGHRPDRFSNGSPVRRCSRNWCGCSSSVRPRLSSASDASSSWFGVIASAAAAV